MRPRSTRGLGTRLSIVAMFALFAVAAVASVLAARGEEEKGGELQARVTVTWTGQFTGKTKEGMEVQDNITVTWTANVRQPVPRGAKVWEVDTGTPDWKWTVSGGGQAKAGKYSESWSYQVKSQRRAPGSSMWPLHLREASYNIVLPDFNEVEIVPVTGGAPSAPGSAAESIEKTMAYIFLAPAAGSARNTLVLTEARAGLDEQFQAQLKGTFDPRSNRVSGSGSPSVTLSQPMDGFGQRSASLQVSYSWSVGAQPAQVEAIIIPGEIYDRWLPRGDEKDVEVPGEYLDVRVVLQKKGQPGKEPRETAKFKFELLDVSKEKGVCLNWPRMDIAKESYDLKIDSFWNPGLTLSSGGQSAESKAGLREVVVNIASYDFGAYGRLQVTATLDDGSSVVAHLKDEPDKTELVMPRDDNDNHIADAWEQQEKQQVDLPATAAGSDEDSFPRGDGDKGDGLPLYEEYRGFVVQGVHLRTHPALKDLFIRDSSNLGAGYFAQSGLSYHLVEERELSDDRDAGVRNPFVINANRGFASRGKEHALWLNEDNLPGLLGMAFCTGNKPGLPKNCWPVSVNVAACKRSPSGEEELKATIAHELAHAANVYHHGDLDYKVTKIWALQPGGTWREEGSGVWTVAARGGQHSGVEECIMRYDGARYYEWEQGPFRWLKGSSQVRGFGYGPGEPPGKIFCTQMTGTGVNEPRRQPAPKAGDASLERGRCQKQFCVNDAKH